ncbi:hypothetical protein Pyrfu_0786 [Pyrolobus fumarii 1A]|uniref:Uncharacterized protein n=1 Tax=Pyrolobus fumarii (strain DSM 11204 / 1A) TaxID=694429 RepID=G0EDH0_PYRF1|nr:cytochrome c3 family protein [Pyrolobus fumarii]AEM38655.1 hypothetical protein Pyrfu_0786 [Pyrolobus fumarii 1A]
MTASVATKLVKTILIIAVFVVAMWGYWKATIPGYFESVSLCSEGCHDTKVLDPKNITGPFWCIGCHGFGVKSEILPGIPFYRDVKLEHLVEEHGECLMCHRVPGEFHWKHLEASEEELAKMGLARPVQCVDCHVNAYHGHHTDKPRNKVCLKCHDAAEIHGDMVKTIRAACTACHSESPVVPAAQLAPNATSYGGVNMAVGMLMEKLGFTYRPVNPCLACHTEPLNDGHQKHYGKEYEHRTIVCIDCHLSDMPHGWKPGIDICVECHDPRKTKLHDKYEELQDCSKCHRGFVAPNVTLVALRGCKGCHGDTIREAVSVGLHLVHAAAYSYNCSVCHEPNPINHTVFVKSAADVELCGKCHDEYGGLKSDALRGLAMHAALVSGYGIMHEMMVKKADGNCFECHYEWHLVQTPRVVYVYEGGER